ncbi:MAG TPA: hypothetical protein VGX92_10875 [Pyrinomonadaceae bacterium]|jgi:hypothetical protein|nr:hypothetical protein [Pyrinomonadaceae bacterium]
MSEDVQPEIVKSTPPRQRFVIYAVVLLVVFLLGFIPMWLKARECARGLAESEHQLILVRMQSNLASAVIDARRGDYEPARQATSQFFTYISEEIDKGAASAFTQAQREGMQPLLTRRDDIITLLARSDPASADRLSDLFVSYRKIMSG